MIHDGTAHQIFRISELASLIAGQLTLISPRSTVNLACTCRCLEEPVLSVLWQTQPQLDTLLKVLPEETWDCDNLAPGESLVRVHGPDPPFEGSSAQLYDCFSSESREDHRRRLGRGSNATRLGCAESTWMGGETLWRIPSVNYASIHPLADGSQQYKIYFGASRNPAFLTQTYSFPHI